MKIVKNLGTTNGKRFGIFECPICLGHFKRHWIYGKRGKTCNSCKGVQLKKSHGLVGKRPYRIYYNMLQRCNNPNAAKYNTYGRRGVFVTEDWNTFEKFWEDMQDGYSDDLTIDRIDSDDGYCKNNCQWITLSENSSKTKKKRKVTQHELLDGKQYGKQIAIFDSARAAAGVVDGCPSSIGKVCRGIKKSAKGYGWKYAE